MALPNLPTDASATVTSLPSRGLVLPEPTATMQAGPTVFGLATANVATQTRTDGVHTIRQDNPLRFPAGDSPATAEAGMQWDAPELQLPKVPLPTPELMSLPTETLQRIMGHLVVEGLGLGDGQAAARQGASSLARASREAESVVGPMLRFARQYPNVRSQIDRTTTAQGLQALTGTDTAPGPLRNLPPWVQEQALARLMTRLDNPQVVDFGESIPIVRTMMNEIGRLSPEGQARVLEEGLRQPSHADAPMFTFLLGNPYSSEPIPGTVLGLPPELREGPMRSVVNFVFGPQTQPRQLGPNTRDRVADMVRDLPRGTGDDLKATVAAAGH